MRRFLIPILFALVTAVGLASGAGAQVLTMGNTVTPNASDVALAESRTDIDFVNPATATGTIDTATFTWAVAGCPSAAKIKVFRRQGDTLHFIAERGPFDVTANSMTVTLARKSTSSRETCSRSRVWRRVETRRP